MRVDSSHWAQIEAAIACDDRCVVPLGCTEQHAFLSLATDSILAERVAVEAARPLGVPVFPVLAYGVTPSFRAYPGTVSLRVETYGRILHDLLDCLSEQGFRRIVFVNGHGGNTPGQAFAEEWMADHRSTGARIRWHNWWNAPQVWAKVQAVDPIASHASWMENFPWTRLAGIDLPSETKEPVDYASLRELGPEGVREGLGDGNFAGRYQRSDAEMLAIWEVAVTETRSKLDDWPLTA